MKRRGFTITSQYGFGVKNGYGLGTEGEPPVLEAPNAPTNFLASDDEVEQITFTWTNSTIGYPRPTYDIYISAGALVVSGVTSPHTEAIVQGTADYIVRAVNSEGTADSDIDSGTSLEPDTTIPVITLLGTTPIQIENGEPYTDAGATALDNVDGDITDNIVTVNPVNIGIDGVYIVTYDVDDSSGNSAVQVTRQVTVADTGNPVITVLGDNPVTVLEGETYVDAGATALDAVDGDITDLIVTVNNVDDTTAGTYTVTYNCTDAANNVATEKVRTVHVVVGDTIAPIYLMTEPLVVAP